ncbi:MAG: flavin reductase family protein [Clostridia bacterium]|nr:flavin reductase family protein [Clostridia bacterium]
MPVSPELQRRAMGQFVTGVAVLTLPSSVEAPRGITVNSLTSLSLEPPLLLVAIDLRSPVNAALAASERFALSILRADQEAISRHFASQPGGLLRPGDLEPGPHGLPLVSGALATLVCRREESFPGGDHTIFVGRLEEARLASEEADPLLYFRGRYLVLPASAPCPGA